MSGVRVYVNSMILAVTEEEAPAVGFAVGGAVGGAITGGVLVWLLRQPAAKDLGASQAAG